MIPKEDIVSYWNKINDPQILIKKYHKEILRLQKMINDLPPFLKDEKLTLSNSNEFQKELIDIGFKSLGYGWFGNDLDDIRIRLWGDEIDVWEWKNNEENQIRFRGKISSIEEVKWALNRCFNINN